VPINLMREAAECSECALLQDKLVMKDVYCWRHHPNLDDRDRIVLDAFVSALLARRATHSRPEGESLTHSIHVVKRRFLKYRERR
jgi:hypothetical protein